MAPKKRPRAEVVTGTTVEARASQFPEDLHCVDQVCLVRVTHSNITISTEAVLYSMQHPIEWDQNGYITRALCVSPA